MGPTTVDELEEFVRTGRLWDGDDLGQMVDRLREDATVSGDRNAVALARFLEAVHLRVGMGSIAPRAAADIEGIVWPRLWKVIEAARDGLPDTEVRIRIEVMNRRLSRWFTHDHR